MSKTLIGAAVAALIFAGCGGGTGSSVPTTGTTAMNPHTSSFPSLKCFSAANGSCSIDSSTGTVHLATSSNPADASTTVAGVYFANSNSLKGTTLNQLTALGVTFGTHGAPYPYAAGSPRIVIPVTFGGSSTNAFLYPLSCAALNSGESGPILAGTVNFLDDGQACAELQSNGPTYYVWSQFVANFGSATITSPPDFLADGDTVGGIWTITNFTIK